METPQIRISAAPKTRGCMELEPVLYAETTSAERAGQYRGRQRQNTAVPPPASGNYGMIKFLKNLFAGSGDSDAEPGMVQAEGVEYKGYLITPSPIVEGGQYRTCGTISHTAEDGQVRHSQYIRADNHSSEQQAIDHAISKGKQVIDERGEGLFASERC